MEGRNFLTIVHDPSSLMGECKEIRELLLMVGKGEVERFSSGSNFGGGVDFVGGV